MEGDYKDNSGFGSFAWYQLGRWSAEGDQGRKQLVAGSQDVSRWPELFTTKRSIGPGNSPPKTRFLQPRIGACRRRSPASNDPSRSGGMITNGSISGHTSGLPKRKSGRETIGR
jgi:hypothetical protein